MIGATAVVENLKLDGATVLASDGVNNAGILAGTLTGRVANVFVSGSVSGLASTMGGMIAFGGGSIQDSTAAAEVTYTGTKGASVGGLVSVVCCDGTGISNSHAVGNVSAGPGAAGGLAESAGYVTDCSATGNVSAGRFAGGLVGNGGEITRSYATGTVTGLSSGAFLGGLLGWGSGIQDSYATGNVVSHGTNNVAGGIVGYQTYSVYSSYSISSLHGRGKI